MATDRPEDEEHTFVVFDGLQLSASRLAESLPKYLEEGNASGSSERREGDDVQIFSFDNFFQRSKSLEDDLEALAQIYDRLDEKRLLRRLVRLSQETAPRSARAQEALGWIYQADLNEAIDAESMRMGLEEGFKYIRDALTSTKKKEKGSEEVGKELLLAQGFKIALEFMRDQYKQFTAPTEKPKARL